MTRGEAAPHRGCLKVTRRPNPCAPPYPAPPPLPPPPQVGAPPLPAAFDLGCAMPRRTFAPGAPEDELDMRAAGLHPQAVLFVSERAA